MCAQEHFVDFAKSDGLARGRMLHSTFALLDILLERGMQVGCAGQRAVACWGAVSMPEGQCPCLWARQARSGSFAAKVEHAQVDTCVDGLQDCLAALAAEVDALHARGMQEGFAPGAAPLDQGKPVCARRWGWGAALPACCPCSLLTVIWHGTCALVHAACMHGSLLR